MLAFDALNDLELAGYGVSGTSPMMQARKGALRVCIVGPVEPFRGGIAKHTTAILQEIGKRENITVMALSFSTLYPAFLYPGQSDKDPESGKPPASVEFSISTVNPLTWIRAVFKIAAFRPDILIIPCWTFFVAPCLGTIARLARRRGVKVVGVIHNVSDHEEAKPRELLTRFQLGGIDRFITHSATLRESLKAKLPTVRDSDVTVHPHPLFDSYPDPVGAVPKSAGINLLFFGLVRAYKGLDILISALGKVVRPDVTLRIVGEFWEGRQEIEQQIADLALGNRVEIVGRYVSDQEAAEYFNAADVVVLPYRTVSASGVISVAYRYGRPVIVSDHASLVDLVVEGKTGWVTPVADVDALAALIEHTLDLRTIGEMRTHVDQMRLRLSWTSFVDDLLGSVAD